jgi:signal recognition particle receptor subunit beta
MALFNYATRELSAKVVYYGPGLSGKTTNIEMVHRILRPEQKGRLISLPTETDRTLFFDFLPVDLGQIKGFKVRFHLYTVPGQVFYNATRRLVLQGVDGVVFVADSQKEMSQSNVESLKNLTENLASYGKKLDELPFVLQYNKCDLKNRFSVREMNALLNPMNVPAIEGIAKDGVGVSETLVKISRMVFSNLRKTLLMPGETAEHEEIGALANARIEESFGKKEAEQLEEISESDMIQEEQEVREAEAPPEEPAFLSGAESVPDEIEFLSSAPPIIEEAGSEKIEFLSSAPPIVEEAGSEKIEFLSSAPPIVEEAGSEKRDSMEGFDEIEIEIPERAPAPPPAPKETRVGISVEPEDIGMTFLKFENPYVSPEGHAVLPAVLMDGAGNIVRLRVRITMEE